MKRILFRAAVILLILALSGVSGFLAHRSSGLENRLQILSEDFEALAVKFKVLKKKYAQEKAIAATLTRAKVAAEGKVRQAQERIEALQQEKEGLSAGYDEKLAKAEKRISTLEKDIENAEARYAKLSDANLRIKDKNEQLRSEIADQKSQILKLTTEGQKLENRVAENEQTIDRCERHNVRLIEISEELLTRYREKTCQDALQQREPFLRFEKVELEHLIQEYENRIDRESVSPEG